MKFKLTPIHRYWWPVPVSIPNPDAPGDFVTQVLKVQFEAQSREDALASQERYAKLKTVRERACHEHDEMKAIVRNWDDVVDDDGGAVAFSQDALESALQQAWFRKALYLAYAASLNGEEPRLGN